MPLQHALHVRRLRVPELDAAVLRARDDPLAVVRHRDAQDVVLRAPQSVFPTKTQNKKEGGGTERTLCPVKFIVH